MTAAMFSRAMGASGMFMEGGIGAKRGRLADVAIFHGNPLYFIKYKLLNSRDGAAIIQDEAS
ncbi:hypothetical protein NB2BOR_A41860 [Bordetella parapertussis]|nr:hypothetical protein NB2BOR_A41860 [Bordetella parapertussis]